MPIDPLPPGEVQTDAALVQTTLGARGPMLPLGLPGLLGVTGFSLRPATVGLAKRLGALRERKDLKAKAGQLIAHLVGASLYSLGGQVFDQTPEGTAAAALAVSKLSAADVMYICLSIILEGGDPLHIDGGACHACATALGRIAVDVGTVETTTLVGAHADLPRARVGLLRPLVTARGSATTVLLRPPTWGETFWDVPAADLGNGAAIQARLLLACVEATDSEAVPRILPGFLDDVPVRLAAQIVAALEKITPTPDMRVEVACPACGAENARALPWQTAVFS